jgi:hypothetical protein
MTLYAKIDPDTLTFTGRIKQDITPVPPDQLAPGKPYYVPVNDVVNDTSTGSDTVREPRVDEVIHDGTTATEYRRTTTIRDRTAQEIADSDSSAVDGGMVRDGTLIRAILHTLFDQENRIRTLEGQGTVTVEQFKSGIKSRIR